MVSCYIVYCLVVKTISLFQSCFSSYVHAENGYHKMAAIFITLAQTTEDSLQ